MKKDGKITTNMQLDDWDPEDVEKDLIDMNKLYDWQKEIVDICKGMPDKRKIYWYWEPNGNIGKTSLVRLLMSQGNASIIAGKKNDILYAASLATAKTYICDFSRSSEEFVPWDAIESIKNGCYMVGKYESKAINRRFPHVICFANFAPDLTKLSADRWVVKKLSEDLPMM